jgi:hypothetical protein
VDTPAPQSLASSGKRVLRRRSRGRRRSVDSEHVSRAIEPRKRVSPGAQPVECGEGSIKRIREWQGSAIPAGSKSAARLQRVPRERERPSRFCEGSGREAGDQTLVRDGALPLAGDKKNERNAVPGGEGRPQPHWGRSIGSRNVS